MQKKEDTAFLFIAVDPCRSPFTKVQQFLSGLIFGEGCLYAVLISLIVVNDLGTDPFTSDTSECKELRSAVLVATVWVWVRFQDRLDCWPWRYATVCDRARPMQQRKEVAAKFWNATSHDLDDGFLRPFRCTIAASPGQ